MELFEVPLYDDDVIKMVGRFAINLIVITVLVRYVYYRRSRSKDYLFSFYMLSIVVFFICFTLKKLELELGMAMGLFAIFGVLRYRTDAMPVREMTYMFIVIGIAVINSLSNVKVSWLELAVVNASFTFAPAMLEALPFLRQELREDIVYERIDLIRPENHDQLIADLQERTGLKLSRIELGRINFLQDTVVISAYYYPHEQVLAESNGVTVGRRVKRT
ncbi:MAG: DUF4956 domain-containing protein [Planctomycetaceae bacterium]|nr:DUF4956 domain-containing protein [Planctomycetaceae bacterium]